MENTTSGNVLVAVAEREGELLAQIAESEQEAARTVEQARDEARRIASDMEKQTAAEMNKLRTEAESARDAGRSAILKAAKDKLDALRARAMKQVPATIQDILALVVPGGAG